MTAVAAAVGRIAKVRDQRRHAAGMALGVAANEIKLLPPVICLGAVGAAPARWLRD